MLDITTAPSIDSGLKRWYTVLDRDMLLKSFEVRVWQCLPVKVPEISGRSYPFSPAMLIALNTTFIDTHIS